MTDTSKLEEGVTEEWRVVWFDPNLPDQAKQFSTEKAAVRFYELRKEDGYAPQLLHVTLTVSIEMTKTAAGKGWGSAVAEGGA